MPARRQAGLKNKGEMLKKKGNDIHPSLRRHYPDQVYGFDLRLNRHWRINTPGTLKECLTQIVSDI